MGERTQRKRQHRKTEAETIAVLRSPDDCDVRVCLCVCVWISEAAQLEVKG